MTYKQYQRIEKLLVQAEGITLEQALLTPQGKKIQGDVRTLLTLIVAAKDRAEQREGFAEA